MWDSSKINSIDTLDRLLLLAGGEKPGVRHINRFAEASLLANGLKENGFTNFLKYIAADALIKQQKKVLKGKKKYLVVYSMSNEYGSNYPLCRICLKREGETFKQMLERERIYSAEIVIEGDNIKILNNWSGK
jgi:hypothetical protein